MRSGHKHWKNFGQGGETVFVTTTVLDFVHAFKRPEIKEVLAREMFQAHERAGAALHAFVIMPHHIHLRSYRRRQRSPGSWRS
jgi:REP element-mobilizing transposase RayT